jgi:hypothetical protein
MSILQTSAAMSWAFLGGTVPLASAAVRTPTVSWTGVYHQLMIEHYVAGYSGNAIARVIVGPASGLSETGTTFCTSLIDGVTITTSSVSVPGWPVAGNTTAARRWGWMFVKNVATDIKTMTGQGNYGGTAPTVVPTSIIYNGLFNDSTNSIQQAELGVYSALTSTTISTTTMNAGSYLNVWGRNDN